MTARTFETPIGSMPLSEGQQRMYGSMSNLELVDQLYAGHHVDPLALNELAHRGLARRGDHQGDIRARVEEHEKRRLLLNEIDRERHRQDDKWGGPQHDDRNSVLEFVEFVRNYAAWAGQMDRARRLSSARRRLIQAAALAVAAVEKIDREAVRRSRHVTDEEAYARGPMERAASSFGADDSGQ